MTKIIILLVTFSIFSFASMMDQNQSIKQELKWDKSKTSFVSKKESEYQAYKKKLDKENKKLEENGFCSCNNN